MNNAFIFSWTPDGYKGLAEGEPVEYSGGGADFERLQPGDRLFILNLARGTVYVLGAMTVGQVVDTAAAKAIRHRIYEKKSHHVIAQPGTAVGFGFRAIPDDRLREIRFITRSGEVGLQYKRGRPDPQTLRRLRQVTDRTAAYLESIALEGSVTSRAPAATEGLALLTDPNAVAAAMAEFRKLGRTAFLEKYGYKKSTRYLLFDGLDHFDSKAIAGVAVGYQHPEHGPLGADEFSVGEGTVVKKLESLGYEVVEQGPGIDWTPEENAAVVAAYFDMLGIVARGESLNKAACNATLRARLRRRTRGSIERKFMNVTAALAAMSKPTLDGYAPNENIQDDLTPAIEEYLATNERSVESTFDALGESADPSMENFDDALEAAPTPRITGKGREGRLKNPILRKLDFAARDKANRMLGLKGEEWVVRYERRKLTAASRPDLAARVEHVSAVRGDGAGYDVLSFDPDGSALHIEVKTTNAGAMSPFMLSPNELVTSLRLGTSYCLYRVHSFRTKPRLFILRGPLNELLLLEAAEYRARVKPSESTSDTERTNW